MRFFLLSSVLLITSGCFASRNHVDRSEKLITEIFEITVPAESPAQPLVREFKKHADEGSGIPLPTVPSDTLSTLANGIIPGSGVLVTTLMGFYARRKKLEADYVTMKAVEVAKEKDPERATAILAQDERIKGYNG